jgi:hypothetical protein
VGDVKGKSEDGEHAVAFGAEGPGVGAISAACTLKQDCCIVGEDRAERPLEVCSAAIGCEEESSIGAEGSEEAWLVDERDVSQ